MCASVLARPPFHTFPIGGPTAGRSSTFVRLAGVSCDDLGPRGGWWVTLRPDTQALCLPVSKTVIWVRRLFLFPHSGTANAFYLPAEPPPWCIEREEVALSIDSPAP